MVRASILAIKHYFLKLSLHILLGIFEEHESSFLIYKNQHHGKRSTFSEQQIGIICIVYFLMNSSLCKN